VLKVLKAENMLCAVTYATGGTTNVAWEWQQPNTRFCVIQQMSGSAQAVFKSSMP
jgi:hypothetical protein